MYVKLPILYVKIPDTKQQYRVKRDRKNLSLFISKGEIRTLDLTGMSRALSPAELPCHNPLFNAVSKSLHKSLF